VKRSRIVIFAKAPLPGKVKTRLIPALGEEGAARLARRMLAYSWREAAAVSIADTELCADPAPEAEAWRGFLPPEAARVSPQGEGDLGERLARAAARVLREGQRILLIGTDCPGLTTSRLTEACRELDAHDAVIHPTFDGGYALLGLSRYHPSIFSGIEWSSSTVARTTIGRIRKLDWSLHLGATLRDIDEPADLELAGRPYGLSSFASGSARNDDPQ
jgi:rSAM/selenodomain-associated transferase 1